MPDPIPIRPRLVLLADANEWSARSLASILGPSGVQVLQLHAAPEVAAAARTQASDAILLTESLPETEEHTSELQSQSNLVCRLLLEKKKKKTSEDRNILSDRRTI